MKYPATTDPGIVPCSLCEKPLQPVRGRHNTTLWFYPHHFWLGPIPCLASFATVYVDTTPVGVGSTPGMGPGGLGSNPGLATEELRQLARSAK